MYRRKTPKANPVQPVEPHPKKEEKNEPVIKAVVAAPRGDQLKTYCPMVNLLRPIKYIEQTDGKGIDFETMINIVLSEGYLKANFDHYKPSGSSAEDWSGIYNKTTGYKRKTFVAGDVIFSKSANRTIAFLISTVRKGGENSDITSSIFYDPPVGDEVKESEEDVFLSSFSDCKGNVYMFAEDVQLKDLVEHIDKATNNEKDLVSKWKEGVNKDKHRKLEPTNMSEYNGKDTANFTSRGAGAETNGKDPDETDYPTVESSATSFNLSNGVTVDGWFIYMYSTAAGTSEDPIAPSNIVGDIVRSGPIVITTVGSETLSLGGIFTFPWIATSATSGKFTYTGNATRFASEPLNSQQYQLNFGNTVANEETDVIESDIYTFAKFSQ